MVSVVLTVSLFIPKTYPSWVGFYVRKPIILGYNKDAEAPGFDLPERGKIQKSPGGPAESSRFQAKRPGSNGSTGTVETIYVILKSTGKAITINK